MPTRIYSRTGIAPAVIPTTWLFANQINPVTVAGTTVLNDGSAMTSKAEATAVTSPNVRAMGRTVWGPLAAQTISGTIRGQMRGAENNIGANATLALAVKLIQPNGADRATLLAQTASDSATVGNELVLTTLTNAQFKNAAEVALIPLTSQTAQAGDYLVIEWGFRSATTTARTITLSYGNNSATELPQDTTTTTANTPWWEFSQTLSPLLPQVIPVTGASESLTPPPVAWAPHQRLVTTGSTTALAQAVAGAQQTRLVTGALVSAQAQTLTSVGVTPNVALPFVNETGITFPGALHGLGTTDLCWALYDAQSPAQQIQPGSLTVTAGSFNVTLGFVQPQSGTLILNARAPAAGPFGNFLYPFSSTTLVVIDALLHGFATPNLLVAVYDALTGQRVRPGRVTVDASSYEVRVSFAQPQSGTVILCGYAGVAGTLNGGTTFPTTTLVTIAGTSHGRGPRLLLDVYDGAGTAILPATVTVDPVSANVNLTFLQPQSGRVVLNGSSRLLSPVIQIATQSALGQPVPWFPQRLASHALSSALAQIVVRQTPAALVAAAPTSDTAQTLLGLPNRSVPLSGATVTTIPASVHGLATADLLVQAYDGSTPARQITPGQVTIDPTSLAVVLTFAQPQSGYAVLNSALAPLGFGNVQFPITSQTMTILGTQHGLRTKDLLVVAYDGQTPARALVPGQVTIHPTTLTVVVTFAQPQSGLLILCGYSSSGEAPNVAVAFPASSTVTVPGNVHNLGTNQLVIQAWSATTPRVLLRPGSLAVDPVSYNVVATFLQPQSGTLVLNGSRQVLLLALDTAIETDTGQAVRWAPQHRFVDTAPTAQVGTPVTWLPQRLVSPAATSEGGTLVHWLPERLVSTALAPLMPQPVLGAAATRVLPAASESLLSQLVAWNPLQRLVTTSSVAETAPLVVWAPHQRLVSTAVTTEVLLPLLLPLIRLVTQALAGTTALGVTAPGGVRLVTTSVLLHTASGIAWAPQARLVTMALATMASQGVTLPAVTLVNVAGTSHLAQLVTAPVGVRLVASQ